MPDKPTEEEMPPFDNPSLAGQPSDNDPNHSAGGTAKRSELGYAYSDNIMAQEMPYMGTKSLFNNYAVFAYNKVAGEYNKLYDGADGGITSIESRNPSAHNIIKWSQENSGDYNPFGPTPYSYSDFLYCKYYGHIPNNYMVTLRRYPVPMLDNLQTHDGRKIAPIAQAVAYLGEGPGNKLSEILKFSCGINWKEIEAKVQEISGNERGFEAAPITAAPGGNVLAGIQGFLNPTEYSGQAQAESDYARELYGSEGPYANKVYGPVNVINKTMARDQGLHFDQDISIVFHYRLGSEGSINPKAAMLDIIGNMLTLAYNNAKFWGGAIRYFPQHPNVPFFGDQDSFYSGDVGGYIDSVMESFSELGDTFKGAIDQLLQDPLATLKELATGGAKFMMGKWAAKDRPQILAMRSLLTGAPVGEWHLVVGNPMNPIAMIGNLICTDLDIELSDKLGADDFPEEIKFTVKLKHGRPRDKGDIESIFNLGNGRMYFGINDDAVFSSTQNSNIDTSGQQGAVGNNTQLGTSAFTPEQTQQQRNNNADLQTPGKSMWGNKFTPSELKMTKVWSGSATSTNSLSGTH